MKISAQILQKMGAYQSCLNRFIEAHGNNELLFSNWIKSESNTILDYFSIIEMHKLDYNCKKDLQLFVVECAERTLSISDQTHPSDDRPRKAIEAAKIHLSGHFTLGTIRLARKGSLANSAVHSALIAVEDIDKEWAVATALINASLLIGGSEKSWQKQRLAEVVAKWGW